MAFKRGKISSHWNVDFLSENLLAKLAEHENLEEYNLQHLYGIILNVLAILISVFLHEIRFFVTLYQILVSTIFIFANEGDSHDSCRFGFNVLVDNWCKQSSNLGMNLFVYLT